MSVYEGHGVTLHHADCLDVLRSLPDCSVDSVVTDPPYGLEFMGKAWDSFTERADTQTQTDTWGAATTAIPGSAYASTLPRFTGKQGASLKPFQDWCEAWATECLRVLKPGGHLLAFGGTRTWHRLACAVEDAGFEVRDSIAWLYGSGFPKSLDVSKAIDKAQGATGTYGEPKSAAHAGWIDRGRMRGDEGEEGWQRPWMQDEGAVSNAARRYLPGSTEAQAFAGWGTALKPAFEPVVVARKPLTGTVAANVLAWGTGALNIDACRVEAAPGDYDHPGNDNRTPRGDIYGAATQSGKQIEPHALGRWPANVVLDESQAAALDEQSGERSAGGRPASAGITSEPGAANGTMGGAWSGVDRAEREVLDKGGASRFFFVASHDKGDTSALTGKGGRIESCETASTAAESSSPPRQFGDSALGGAVTSEHPDTASQTGSPSTSATPSGSRPSGRPATPTTQNIDAESSPEQQPGERTPTASPASSVGPSAPTVTTTTTTSPSTSAGSAAPATSDTTSQWKALGDTDSAPFKYVAKADASERPRVNGTAHPTVKPLDLMRWLVRLVTPPGGTVLEPFAGSGTTVEACIIEGFQCIAIEREADYLPLIRQRIDRRRDPVEALRGQAADLGLFDLLGGEGA